MNAQNKATNEAGQNMVSYFIAREAPTNTGVNAAAKVFGRLASTQMLKLLIDNVYII